jgi:hypothetical protein
VSEFKRGDWVLLEAEGTVEFDRAAKDGRVKVMFDGPPGNREFAWVHIDRLTKIRPSAKVGEFYRIQSTYDMRGPYQGNPLVKVIEVDEDGDLTVKTVSGAESAWSADLAGLVGPLKVEVIPRGEVWVEAPE